MGKPWANHTAQTPAHTRETAGWARGFCGADDGTRTRDPHLGKVMLYQLSHVRVGPTP